MPNEPFQTFEEAVAAGYPWAVRFQALTEERKGAILWLATTDGYKIASVLSDETIDRVVADLARRKEAKP